VTTVLAAFPYAESLHAREELKLHEAYLVRLSSHMKLNVLRLCSQISSTTITVYFLAGLLPDPDGPFEPTLSHMSAWILSMVFELILLCVTGPLMGSLKTAFILLVCLRLTNLLAMCIGRLVIIWWVARDDDSAGAYESLLQAEQNGCNTYGTGIGKNLVTNSPEVRQRSGWLDYFIGFRVLFPYIW
jgi:hypothetical protein